MKTDDLLTPKTVLLRKKYEDEVDFVTGSLPAVQSNLQAAFLNLYTDHPGRLRRAWRKASAVWGVIRLWSATGRAKRLLRAYEALPETKHVWRMSAAQQKAHEAFIRREKARWEEYLK